MALDIREIKKTVIDSIKAAIGDDLSQTTNPDTLEVYGTVFTARPNPELPIPEYPYAVLDVTDIKDTDWYLTELAYCEDTDNFEYYTHKTLTMQVSIYGGDALTIADKLKTAYRRDDILAILALGNIGICDVQQVQIIPELLQTDFLEVSFVQLTIRANDIYVDPDLESIENVILDGELDCNLSDDPLEIHIDTTT